MLNSALAHGAMVVAPHHLAAEAGIQVMRDGGNAIEAMVAAAAAIAVVYPHMNGIGGDGFWLINIPGRPAVAIEACGWAGVGANARWYEERGHSEIPTRGPGALNTVAGTVSGWERALEIASDVGGTCTLEQLLEPAIGFADNGVAVTRGFVDLLVAKLPELAGQPGFAQTYLNDGAIPRIGDRLKLPRLANTLRQLATEGLDSMYRGDLARVIERDLLALDCPITVDDFVRYNAQTVTPLELPLPGCTLLNLPPPTQGLVSLLILGAYEKVRATDVDSADFYHRLVEATKQAFLVRDREITDPNYMRVTPQSLLVESSVASLAAHIDPDNALAWPSEQFDQGDTVWLGAADSNGIMVSFIQSVYWEFGAGVVLEESGIQYQNRGASFSLESGSRNQLTARRRPFHTLNPAMAKFDDGRVMCYGTMGGEGQPQTQAAVFARYAWHGQGVQHAVTAPRWLLGRTWGDTSTTLKLESRIPESVRATLEARGHDIETVQPFDAIMGHAGAIVRNAEGLLEGGADPRSDGRVAAI